MSFDDNHQYIIAIPNANGESRTIFFTPELLPEQIVPLVQKKHLKEEKLDSNNYNSVYKKILENLTEGGGSNNLSNIIDVNSIVNLCEKAKTSGADTVVENRNSKNTSSTAPSIIRNLQTNIGTGSTFLLQTSNLNQNSQSLSTSLESDQTVISENSSNYITTLQISQNNSNLSTLAFNQPLLHYSKQNQDSPNTLFIPISLQNSNQYTQQQIIVATGGYNQNCSDGINNTISNSNQTDSLNVTSLAKLISSNCSNPLSVNLNSKSNSSCSEISPNSKLISKSKSSLINNENFGNRKEIRLLKNREAARECRRKKKEYVKCLENRVLNLEQQNKVLVDEINKMKEICSKKSSKSTVHIFNSDGNSKFVDIYASDSAIKEDMFDSTNEESVSSKEKQYAIPTGYLSVVGNPQSNSSEGGNFGVSKSKSNTSNADHSHIITNAAEKDNNLFLKLKKDSSLSSLLTSDHKQYGQPVFEPTSIIFPESVRETPPNNFNDSRNSCDSN